MEDVKAQLALLTRVVTDLQKVVLELKAEISALRSQSSLPKAVEPLKAVETPPATATSGLEIPDEPWTDAEAKTQAPCGSTGKQLVKTPKIVAETDLTSREKVELFAGLFAGRSRCLRNPLGLQDRRAKVRLLAEMHHALHRRLQPEVPSVPRTEPTKR